MMIPRRAWSRASASALLLIAATSAAGCRPGPTPASPAVGDDGTITIPLRERPPAEPPPRPLALPEPPMPPPDPDDPAPARGGGRALAAEAARLAEAGDPRGAARLRRRAVAAGEAGTYDLACWTALAGDVDGAFYWLQEAALGDGVDASWAGQDPDLGSLRADPRWAQVAPFLGRCNAYWAGTGRRETTLVVPAGYRPGTPIGVVVAMHGRGSRPGDLVDPGAFQPLADELGLAFVGVSGTVATGRHSYVWSEDPARDAAHVRRALADLAGRLTARPGRLIALGFSQGGQLGFEVAFKHPAEYRGAIVISPGTTNRFFRLGRLSPTPANRGQGYVCLCGAGEAPGNVAFTRADADFARAAGARVELRLAEGQSDHALPADFARELPAWVRFVEGEAGRP